MKLAFIRAVKFSSAYTSERRKINGKIGSVLVPSEQAESVRIAFQMYQNPDYSLKKIIVTLRTERYKTYFQSMGCEIIDDIEVYDGIHGLFVHAGGER